MECNLVSGSESCGVLAGKTGSIQIVGANRNEREIGYERMTLTSDRSYCSRSLYIQQDYRYIGYKSDMRTGSSGE